MQFIMNKINVIQNNIYLKIQNVVYLEFFKSVLIKLKFQKQETDFLETIIIYPFTLSIQYYIF